MQCDISHLVELAYPNDPPTIRDRTAKNFFIDALTPLYLKEQVLDMNPQTLDDCVAAAQRFETKRKVLDKGTSHVLAAGVPDEQVRDGIQKSPLAGQKNFFSNKLKF